MSKFSMSTSDNLCLKKWSSQFMHVVPRQTFWLGRFSGDYINRVGLPDKEQKQYLDSRRGVLDGGGMSIVHVFKDLLGRGQATGIGDRLRVGLEFQLNENGGVTEGQTLENNEAGIDLDDIDITLSQYRHAVRSNGRMDLKRTNYNFPEGAKRLLYNWAGLKIDATITTAMVASPTEIYYFDGTDYKLTGTAGTASAALVAASSKLTPAMISLMKSAAMTGRNGQRPIISPIMVNGNPMYVAVVHSDAFADMRRNAEWTNIINSGFQGKGGEHPLLKGAECVYDDVIIHSYSKMPIYTTGGAGSDVAWTHGKFLGAEAVAFAMGCEPFITAESFDFGNEVAYGIDMDFGITKPQFTDPISSFTFDHSQFSFYVSRTKQSDITLA